jgi:hypothetical protein
MNFKYSVFTMYANVNINFNIIFKVYFHLLNISKEIEYSYNCTFSCPYQNLYYLVLYNLNILNAEAIWQVFF